ncbi:hypothetical protein KCU85_g382, partial [Aureobasidium melanogenum]
MHIVSSSTENVGNLGSVVANGKSALKQDSGLLRVKVTAGDGPAIVFGRDEAVHGASGEDHGDASLVVDSLGNLSSLCGPTTSTTRGCCPGDRRGCRREAKWSSSGMRYQRMACREGLRASSRTEEPSPRRNQERAVDTVIEFRGPSAEVAVEGRMAPTTTTGFLDAMVRSKKKAVSSRVSENSRVNIS